MTSIGPVRRAVEARISAGELQEDPQQLALADQFDALFSAISTRQIGAQGFRRLFSRPKEPPVKGLYIHGAVGRGKTMLMDLFFAAVEDASKRRCHFHEFMADVHDRIHHWRQHNNPEKGSKSADPIGPVATALAAEAKLLCFDEFFVTDIADAMILARLFTELFAQGVTLIATSNTAPENLYEGGLNRALFMPFIALLNEHTTTIELRARTDYRMETLAAAGTYFTPLGDAASNALDATFQRLLGGEPPAPMSLSVKSRNLAVPAAGNGVAKFHFDDLCDQPLGARDYQALAQQFHTLVVSHVPILSAEARNPTRRFIILIDTLYNAGTKLVLSADAPPEQLLAGGPFVQEFARTQSRLTEMQSQTYLAAARATTEH